MKLYWRVKIDGKWTWKAAEVIHDTPQGVYVYHLEGTGNEAEMS